MTPLFLHSERFPATGGMPAGGLKRVLGKAKFNALELVVRELAQNSWDARATAHVTFSLDVRTLEGNELGVLADEVFGALPANLALRDSLERARKHGMRVLIVSDQDTVGLGGPTRADVEPGPEEPLNFLKFMRNFGYGENAFGSGGTYGYGKSSAYVASRADTIVMYTRWRPVGQAPISRFMASALGDRDGLLTGRHWWGEERDGLAEPVEGDSADSLAERLGLPVMKGDDTGTSIVILDPDLDPDPDPDLDPDPDPDPDPEGDHGPRATLQDRLVAAVLWNLWPKLIHKSQRAPDMRVLLAKDGVAIEVPNPRTVPLFEAFCEAFDLCVSPVATAPAGSTVEDLRCERPRRPVGRIALVKRPVDAMDGSRFRTPWAGSPRHVALMRQPDLVVKYEEHRALPNGEIGYVGVFKVDDTAEDAFRSAETTTHDEWNSEPLTDSTARRLVNSAKSRRREATKRFADSGRSGGGNGGGGSTGQFASQLGDLLLSATTGHGATGENEPRGPRRPVIAPRIPRATVETRGTRRVVGPGGSITAEIRVTVTAVPESPSTLVRATAGVALEDGTTEEAAPTGSLAPRVIGWRSPDGEMISGTDVTVPAGDSREWTAIVQLVNDAMAAVTIEPVATH